MISSSISAICSAVRPLTALAYACGSNASSGVAATSDFA